MRKPNLKKIDLWSIRLKSIVIIVTIFFIAILGYFFFLRSTLEEKEKIYFTFQVCKKELNNQKGIFSEYSNYLKKIKNIKNKFGICSQQLDFWQGAARMKQPECISIHEDCELSGNTDKNSSAKSIRSNDVIDKVVLNTLSGQISAPFLKINKIDILSTKNKNFANYLQVESNFSSIYKNIFYFLYQISSLNRFILIENFRWNFFNRLPKTKKQSIIFSFKVYTPYFNSKNLMLALKKINKIGANLTSEKNNLIKYPLAKIKMLGFLLIDKGQNLGFVALPNKQIFKIQLGDQLGLERGLVIGIYDQQIYILNENFQKIIKLSMENRKFYYVKNFP
jgi:Tfp pilus assembly protein PilO